MIYIRYQSHIILGLFIVAASPLPLSLNQNYNSQGIPYVTPRAIAFNSHRVNLLTVYLTFTLLDALFEFLLCQPISGRTSSGS